MRSVRGILVFVIAALIAGSAAAAPLRITFDERAVQISGVTTKGQVVLLGVSRTVEEDDFTTVRRYREMLSDEDGDGTVRYQLQPGVPLRSVWAAVDLTSGQFEAGAPADFRVHRVNWRGRGLIRRPDGLDAVEDVRTLSELLVVRPSVGAWALRVSDGDETDEDNTINGRLQGVLDHLEPLGSSPEPPMTFQRDDVVLALDPTVLELTLVKVPAGN